MKIKYTIKKGEEDKGLDAIILKTGGEVEFTLGDIESDITYLQKAEKELVAQIGIHKATVENVKRTHPKVLEMTGEFLTAAYLYREATGFLNIAEDKLLEVKKQLEEYASDKIEILDQTKLNLNETK